MPKGKGYGPDKSIHGGRRVTKKDREISSGRKSTSNISGGRKSSGNIHSGNKVRSIAKDSEIPAKTKKPRTRRKIDP